MNTQQLSQRFVAAQLKGSTLVNRASSRYWKLSMGGCVAQSVAITKLKFLRALQINHLFITCEKAVAVDHDACIVFPTWNSSDCLRLQHGILVQRY